MKHAIAQADGTPAFQQSLWAEGAEEELQNKCTAAESRLCDQGNIFLIKGDAASWQLVMLNDPGLFEALDDFMALSKWREEGGYEQAGKTMAAKIEEWESESSGLSKRELLRRKVVVGCFFNDCGGQFERAIELLEEVAAEIEEEQEGNKELKEGAQERGGQAAGEEKEEEEQEEDARAASVAIADVLSTAERARLHMALGTAYAGREGGLIVGVEHTHRSHTPLIVPF
jgi:hypothetical protein